MSAATGRRSAGGAVGGRPRRRRAAVRLALVAGSTLLALVVAEVGLRAWFWSRGVGRSDLFELLRRSQQEPVRGLEAVSVYGIVQPSPHPEIVYELRPQVEGTFRGRPYRTNAFGLRGPEVAWRKRPGTIRVAGLGDSHMFGWGVGQDELYLSILQRRFDDAAGAGKTELLNFAAPGYNAVMEVATYERKARHFDPDLILIHYVGNDVGLPHLLQPPRPATPNEWYLTELVRALLVPDPSDELELLPHDLREVPKDVARRARADYEYMLGAEAYRRAMEKLARLAAEDSIPVVVLMLVERPEVREVAEPLGFRLLDAAPAFLVCMEREGVEATHANWKRLFKIPRDGHPTPLAHRCYADALFDELAGVAGAG